MAISYNSNFVETMPFSDVSAQIGCGANVDRAWTVPGVDTQQYQAYFSYASNSNVYVCNNSVATIPVIGSVGTQPYNDFKPVKRYVRGGDVLHFITPDATAYVGVSLRQLPG